MGDDPLGRRKGKTLAGVTTRYLYDGANPIQEKQNGTVTANLLAGPNLDEWYARTSAGQTQTYLPDALGSTLKLTDSSQAIVASYTYAPQEIPWGDEPYGKATVTGNPGTNSLGYTGREDDGTGLYYYRARYYHPGISRFVSEDPIGLDGGANLFSYADGDPISLFDPQGLSSSDNWYGKDDPAFRDWMHQLKKGLKRAPNENFSKAEIEEYYKQWCEEGKPRGKGGKSGRGGGGRGGGGVGPGFGKKYWRDPLM